MHTDEESRKEHTRRDSGLPLSKEADVKRERDNLQGASPDGIFATTTLNRATEHAQQQPWRTEPEIEMARQEQLTRRLATTPDVTRGIYPFKGMKLSRADIEWLLATDENGRGPRVDRDEQKQNCRRLDLRGADLRYVDLHTLPLARLRGSLTREEWDEATAERRAAAAVLLTGADLSEAHLEEYGYLPGRSVMAYLVVIFGFMGLYLLNAHGAAAHLSGDEALVLSVSSFHGRGFFPQNVALGDTFARLAAAEAVLGLLIEISFIATFTQRFFGR